MVSTILAVALVSNSLLVTDWMVELKKPEDANEQIQAFQLGGLQKEGQDFYIAGVKKRLERRSSTTGEVVWKANLESSSQARWTILDGRLYGGDNKGFVYSLDAETGKIIWKNQTKGIFFAAPLVTNSAVFFVNSFGSLQAYEKETGKWIWQQVDPAESFLGLWSGNSPVVFQNSVHFGFPSGSLQSFDLASGNRLWTEVFNISSEESFGLNDVKALATDPSGKYLAVSSYSGNFRIFQSEGKGKKRLFEAKISLASAPVFYGKDLILTSDRSGNIRALEVGTGFVRWEYRLPSGLGSQAAVSENGDIWVGTSTGFVVVLSSDGKEKSVSKSFETGIFNAPVLLDSESALVMTERGIVRKMRLFTSSGSAS